jgi:protein SCO1/2
MTGKDHRLEHTPERGARGSAISLSRLGAIALALLFAAPAGAEDNLPEALRGVGFDQNLGAPVPLDLDFRDESGAEVILGDYFGERPVILTLVYYECPMLCTLVLNGLVQSLRAVPFDVGKDFEIVTVSFDPTETPALARRSKETYVTSFGRPEAEAGWHFLTGSESAIEALTAAVGFRYTYDPELKQFAHASGIMILTPDGRLARYFFGVEYAPKDVRLGLVEASEGKIGNLIDQVLLFCFHYDPEEGKYGAAAMNGIRAGGVVTLAAIGLYLLRSIRRDRRREVHSRLEE